jgi:multiple sugar transport system ATP-binding protein
MVRRPKVFLLDEPLSNLDAKLRVDTRTEIAQLHRRLGTTFVYVTHDQVEAMTMSDRVALMIDGRILQLATPQQIYDDPRHLRVAEFIGTPRINTLPARNGPDGVVALDRPWPVLAEASPGSPLTVAFRPEHLAIPDGDEPAGGCVLDGTVAHLELLGAETLVHVAAGASTVVARVAPARAAGLRTGGTLRLAVPAERVIAFDADGVRVPTRAATRPERRSALHA